MIKWNNIKLSYGNKTVFDNFNLSVNTGETVLLRAPSGAGKTTLMKMLLGLVKPQLGEIMMDDKTLNYRNIQYFRKRIGYVSQGAVFNNNRVDKLIDEILSYKVNRNIIISSYIIEEKLEYFELNAGIMKKNINQLSGGERQRLGLIICILLDREIWLLDEITAGIDKKLKRKVVDYILSQEKTILISSHDSIWLESDSVRVKEWERIAR